MVPTWSISAPFPAKSTSPNRVVTIFSSLNLIYGIMYYTEMFVSHRGHDVSMFIGLVSSNYKTFMGHCHISNEYANSCSR